MTYEKPELWILRLASVAVRGCISGSDSSQPGERNADGAIGSAKMSTLKEGAVYDGTGTSSTASAYEADE